MRDRLTFCDYPHVPFAFDQSNAFLRPCTLHTSKTNNNNNNNNNNNKSHRISDVNAAKALYTDPLL